MGFGGGGEGGVGSRQKMAFEGGGGLPKKLKRRRGKLPNIIHTTT